LTVFACCLLLLILGLVAVRRDSPVLSSADTRSRLPRSFLKRMKGALDTTNLTLWATQVAGGQPAGAHNVFSFPPLPLLPGASDPRPSFVVVDKDAGQGKTTVKVEFGGGFGSEGVLILLGVQQPPVSMEGHARIVPWTSNIYLYCSP
jgi:hypothetical protein